MRLLPSDPDIETIVSRIKSGDIDLQPDFQRGEVWTRAKKQRLVDSVLRDWHVPPIHVIEDVQTRKQEVLDGQQRLVAIRDFVDGEFALDGEIEPIDESLVPLHGKKYRDLPDSWKRRFNQFTIRLFRIVDYRPGEPGELFFRLNQPTSLTGAEQRNAFFGPVRAQIKGLVESLEDMGLGKEFLGFSNSRMAYDDVLSRVALTLKRGSLEAKVKSSDLIELYRAEDPLDSDTVDLIHGALTLFSDGRSYLNAEMKFNKATLSTWLLFVSRCLLRGYGWLSAVRLAEFIDYFEGARILGSLQSELIASLVPADWLFNVYESRSSARVADVSSVLLRDATLWLVFADYVDKEVAGVGRPDIDAIRNAFDEKSDMGQLLLEDDLIARRLTENGWGRLV
ncbi:TPA: DUF262 domain-containing protein [Burkholderia cenocepacia]|uniref:DUF262 domain-containing protein n=1 Tax=Burkholderia cenocepacia TaxID=95486 RepID=UPI0009B3E976|nr:DUF262 domain-containing protein [Burkholderia cenocepacia]MCA8007144.1 DUF262 domain-containing protein [Burkholderia cenocepacia]MCW5119049.1 DUF262 domain-containing protein [Burkholderia cenocepacia]MCW5132756.1 DUF262 domain-containing protein [Burkholderia cenocepacia]MCW5174539.1 DUF262 domain-containing protein [Burkholderia cenocepacia]MEB2543477.1 DUF262 domain-containing protein [Burkholderia cenocepacia]